MHTHTRIQNVHIYERTQSTSETTAPQRLRGKPNLTPRSSALLPVRCNPEGDILCGQQPNCPSRGTTDKRRTTTTNSSSSHHHDSAPSRPHPLICTGAETIHPVHGPPKLRAWPCPPETRSFFCHFGGYSISAGFLQKSLVLSGKIVPKWQARECETRRRITLEVRNLNGP